MEQVIKIAKMLRDIATILGSSVTLIGAGFIGGVVAVLWAQYDARNETAEQCSKTYFQYQKHYDES